MSIGESFYLLFKSNAKEVVRDTKAAKMGVDQLTESTGKADDKTKQLGKSYTSAIESATQALAAYFSFNAMKSGVIDAQQFNRELGIQSRKWGENTGEIAAYASAIKTAGGNAADLYGWYDKIFKENASRGAGTRSAKELLDEVHNRVKGLDAKSAQFIFDQYGIDNVYIQDMLRQSDDEYKKAFENGKKLTSEAQKGTDAAEEWGKAYGRFSASLNNFWTTIGTKILPSLSALFDALARGINWLAQNEEFAVGVFAAMALGATALSLALPGLIAGFGGMAAAGASAVTALSPLLLILTKVLAVSSAIGAAMALDGAAESASAYAVRGINRLFGIGDKDGNTPGLLHKRGKGGASAPLPPSGGGSDSMAFWLAQGYTKDQAAGMVANEMAESGGRAGARGDGGQAHGLFQWHPDRRKKIFEATGIDVSTAGREDQLRAAAWEMKADGYYDRYKNVQGAANAGAWVSQFYERPRDRVGEAMKRGNMAMDIASQTPFASAGGGGSTSVSIGEVTINTQATDANSIAKEAAAAFKRAIQTAHAQSNDAVAY